MLFGLKINAYGHIVFDVDGEPVILVPGVGLPDKMFPPDAPKNPDPLYAPGSTPDQPMPLEPAPRDPTRQGPEMPPVLPRAAIIVYGPRTIDPFGRLQLLPDELTGQLLRNYAPGMQAQRLGYFGNQATYDFALRPQASYDILKAVRSARKANVRLQIWTPMVPDLLKK